MTIEHIIQHRQITEVLHFTTNLGLLGTLYSQSLKSRHRLTQDKQLEYIFSPNAAFRKDAAWLDYVNLSISQINSYFFNVSAGRWHRDRDIWWCVLSFSPKILTHEGVWFTSTNNIYTGVTRGQQAQGLESVFAERVVRWNGNIVCRGATTPACNPTCEQAEVLYPGEVSTNFLRKIYVSTEDDADEICGHFCGVGHPEVDLVVLPSLFNNGE